MVLWDFTGTNGIEGDGGGGGGESQKKKKKDSPTGLLLFAMLKWGTVNLWGEAVTTVVKV